MAAFFFLVLSRSLMWEVRAQDDCSSSSHHVLILVSRSIGDEEEMQGEGEGLV